MPLYTFQCAHDKLGCGKPFPTAQFMQLIEYAQHQREEFRAVECPLCGRFGAKRWYGPGSMPTDITPKGTFGRTNSPHLKGKMFYGKEERDRMTSVSGTVIDDSRQDWQGGSKNRQAKKFKYDGEGMVEQIEPLKDSEKTVVEWLRAYGEEADAELVRRKTRLSMSAVRKAFYSMSVPGGPLKKVGHGKYRAVTAS